jgi:hypothetical protein
MSGSVDAATSNREGAQISGIPELMTPMASTAKPKEGSDKEPGLHEGQSDDQKYRNGYPPTPGRMFGSGN